MTTAAEWAERMREWEATGESAQEFAKRCGCKVDTLKWWKTHLAKRERDGSKAVKLVSVVRCDPQPAMSTAVTSPDAQAADMGLVIELRAGARLRVQRGFDAVLLRQVIHALEVR